MPRGEGGYMTAGDQKMVSTMAGWEAVVPGTPLCVGSEFHPGEGPEGEGAGAPGWTCPGRRLVPYPDLSFILNKVGVC